MVYVFSAQQWSTADAEIKDPPGGSPGLSKVPSFLSMLYRNTARASSPLISDFLVVHFLQNFLKQVPWDVIRDVKRIDLSHHDLIVVGVDFYWVCFFSFVLFIAFWSFHLYLMHWKSSLKLLCVLVRMEARLFWCLPSCLETRGCHLIPTFYLLSCYST